MNCLDINSILSDEHGKEVILIRPLFGKQSDSMRGTLNVMNENNQTLMFSVSGPVSTLFYETDVFGVENGKNNIKIIRLKGIRDYDR